MGTRKAREDELQVVYRKEACIVPAAGLHDGGSPDEQPGEPRNEPGEIVDVRAPAQGERHVLFEWHGS